MDTRKYIKISCTNLLFRILTPLISSFLIIDTAYSEAWIVDTGKYKYSATHMFIDSNSISKKKLRQQRRQDLLLQEYRLTDEKEELLSNNANTAKIKAIDKKLDATREEREKLPRPTDHSFSKIEVEYGVSDGNSVGLVIAYDIGQFDYKYNYSNSAEVYFKHLLWRNDNFVITMAPRFNALNYDKDYNQTMLGNGLHLGYSKCDKKEYCRYREVGIYAAKTINKTPYKEVQASVTFQEGYKFPSGFSLSNFIELEHVKTNKKWNEANFFEQISVAKTFNIASFNCNDLTLQFGYFWKGSLKGNFDTISGPIISLWLTI